MRETIAQLKRIIATKDAQIQALRESQQRLVDALQPVLRPWVEALAEEVVDDRIDRLSIS